MNLLCRTFLLAAMVSPLTAGSSSAAPKTTAKDGLIDLSSESLRSRELYQEFRCEENGRTVSISDSCCQETAAIQKHGSSAFIPNMEPICDQIDADDFLDNIETYCHMNVEDNRLNCTYDVKVDNLDCASKFRRDCKTRGGRVFASNITLTCDELSLDIVNSLTCLGSSCSHRDVQEYLWVGDFTNHDHLGTCKTTEINGQSREARKRDDAISTAIGVVLIVGFLVFYIYIRTNIRASRHNQQLQRYSVAVPTMEMSTAKATPVNGQLA